MATNVNWRRLACVKCDRLQPENGKLLKCFHVTCPACAADCVDGHSNCITCSFCGAVTEPLVTGVPLVQQLASCEPSLYTTADTAGQLAATASGIVGQERRLCDLCDDGDEGEATHWCERCNDALLCAKHVEHHSRKRVYADHVIQPLSDDRLRSGKLSTLRGESACCFFHVKRDVIMFCITCSHGVCGECVSSGGHNGHTFESLQSVADKERAAVKSLMEPKAEAADATRASPLKAIGTLIEAASEEMDEMREEARIASAVVTDAFSRIESVLQEKRQELLREIEKRHWKQLEVSESRQQCLYRLEETHATLSQLTERLTNGEMKETEVIRVAGALKERLTMATSELRSAQSPQRRARITAAPSHAAIHQVEAEIMSVMQVYEAEQYDVTKSIVTIPDDIYVCEVFSALITLPIPTGNPTAELTATYIAPSAQTSSTPVTQSAESSRTEIVLSAQIKPMEEGDYTLEIRDSSGGVKSVAFRSSKSCAVPVLDPQKCSSDVTLSNNNLTATHTGSDRTCRTVAARDGYQTGRHSWNVRLSTSLAKGSLMGFGVITPPPSQDYNLSPGNFCGGRYYCWWSNGTSYVQQSGQVDHCARMQDGDTVTLTLDCDNATLELHVHRTDKRHTISGCDCSQPLYPAFCFYTSGLQAEFY